MALFSGLTACQTPAPNNAFTPQVTTIPEATATPEITGNSALADLLAYLPSSWVGRHLPVAWGPAIHFVDVAQIRRDLELADFSGADAFVEKQVLILQVHNQGLTYLPASLHIVGSNSFSSLGWDIADVAQVLYLPDADTAILRGDFARAEIQTALQANGTGTAYRAFTFYPAGSDGLYIAWKEDTLIVSGLADGEYIVKALIDNQAYPGLAVQTKIQALLPHMVGAWGAVLAPSPDTAAFSAQNMSNLPPEMQDQLEERFGSLVMPALAWDFMAMQHRQEGDTTRLVLVYNYPTADAAAANRNTVLISLTETPSTQGANQTWADLLTVDRVMTVENQVVVQAHTEATNFIGNAFNQRDFTGFLALPIDVPTDQP
jgi:hypothetical protein